MVTTSAAPSIHAPDQWAMRISVLLEKRPCPSETMNMRSTNQLDAAVDIPTTHAALLAQVSSIHSWDMNEAESVIQKSKTAGLPNTLTKPIMKAVCGWSRCSTNSTALVVSGKCVVWRYLMPR